MKYKASLDNTSKTVTVIITVLFLAIFLFQVSVFIQHRTWPAFAVSLLLVFIYIMTYSYHPVNYVIRDNSIVVHRYVSDVVLSRSDIRNIELIDKQKLRGAIRTFGVGGMFGYFGQFLNRDLGCMTWYATQRDQNAILIELNNNKKIILTPDEPEQFIRQLSVSV